MQWCDMQVSTCAYLRPAFIATRKQVEDSRDAAAVTSMVQVKLEVWHSLCLRALVQGAQIGEPFFRALERVCSIHANCRSLLRTQHQRAGLELMDLMSSYQETAYEHLCRSGHAPEPCLSHLQLVISGSSNGFLLPCVSAYASMSDGQEAK